MLSGVKVWTNVQGFSEYLELFLRKRDGLADAWQLLGSDAEERGDGIQAVEVGVAGTDLTEQVFGNETAQIHRLLILTEPLHQRDNLSEVIREWDASQ